jgi:hypothetical protein
MCKFVIILLFGSLFMGCKKDSTTSIQDSFSGYYKVKKITSTVAVDMNNDGLKSSNLYYEISDPVTEPNGQRMSFYDFESFSNYLEVRHLDYQTDRDKFISFNFPHQIIDSLSNDTLFLVTYSNQFLAYTYEFTSNNKIRVTSSNLAHTDQIGKINELTLNQDSSLTVGLKKRVFDFVDKNWQEINIVAEYSKVQ